MKVGVKKEILRAARREIPTETTVVNSDNGYCEITFENSQPNDSDLKKTRIQDTVSVGYVWISVLQ